MKFSVSAKIAFAYLICMAVLGIWVMLSHGDTLIFPTFAMIYHFGALVSTFLNTYNPPLIFGVNVLINAFLLYLIGSFVAMLKRRIFRM